MQPQFDENICSYKTIKTNNNVNCIRYTEDKKSLAVGSFDGTVTLFNIKNIAQEIILQDKETKEVDNVVTCIQYAEKKGNCLTCSYAGGLIKQWATDTGLCKFTINERRQTMGIAFHPKHPKIFAYGDDGKILLYDEETTKNELTYQSSESNQLDGHTTKIFSLCFNPVKPNEFVSGGWDNVIYFWDARIPSAVRTISDVFIGGDGISINKKGTEICTAEFKRENPMKLWDYKTGKLITKINPDSVLTQLYSVKYATDTVTVVGGSENNILRVVNMKTYTTISAVKTLPSGVYGIDLSPNQKKGQYVNKFDELADLPNIAFCSGKFVYELRYR